MTDPYEIIDRLYAGNPELRDLLVAHSESVARKAEEIGRRSAVADQIDFGFVREASLLHDIGIIRCDAPSIHCHGDLPYICHGIEGRAILDAEGLPRHALVCERHTGSGITVADINRQHLSLPRRDMTPQTLEEKLICYADKFFSKSRHPLDEKPLSKIISQMEAFSPDTLARFMALHTLFQPKG